jgi:hypothetical protein
MRSRPGAIEVCLRLEVAVQDDAGDACLGGDVLEARARIPRPARRGGMEPLWSPVVATGAISGKSTGRELRENQSKPLPCVATGCRVERMVRVHQEREGVASLAPQENSSPALESRPLLREPERRPRARDRGESRRNAERKRLCRARDRHAGRESGLLRRAPVLRCAISAAYADRRSASSRGRLSEM